ICNLQSSICNLFLAVPSLSPNSNPKRQRGRTCTRVQCGNALQIENCKLQIANWRKALRQFPICNLQSSICNLFLAVPSLSPNSNPKRQRGRTCTRVQCGNALQIENCKLQIANWRKALRQFAICNLQSSICNLFLAVPFLSPNSNPKRQRGRTCTRVQCGNALQNENCKLQI